MPSAARDKQIVIFGGARDYHAVDWYRSARSVLGHKNICLLTDSFDGEGFQKIVLPDDDVRRLLIVDRFLFTKGSTFSNVWRNFVKLMLLPMQAVLLRRFVKRTPDCIIHAHPMYYMLVSWFAGVDCGVTPQGSEILVRPNRSIIYKFFLKKALSAASFITVDSIAMKNSIYNLCGKDAFVVQNGIDTKYISSFLSRSNSRSKITSIRGFTSLYRIDEIISARDRMTNRRPLNFVSPFQDDHYRKSIEDHLDDSDQIIGRVDKDALYQLLSESLLVISIPSSDSSPRSVYEAIFAGACVAAVYNPYMDQLPGCMKSRIFEVDLEDPLWLENALQFAAEKSIDTYCPSSDAIQMFDQYQSMKRLSDMLYR